MDRRDFMRAGSAVAASSIAGCTGALSGAQPEKARERITAAEEKFEANGEEMNELHDEFVNDEGLPDSYDPSSITSRVEQANVELDEAEEYATDEQQQYVETLRRVGEYQSAIAEAFEDIVALKNKMDTVTTYLESERYEKALEKIDESRSLVSNVRTHLDAADSAISDVDADSLDESGRIAYDDITTDLSKARDQLDLVEKLLDGIEPMVKGMQDFMPGAEAFGNERYSVAAEKFADAEAHFQTADEQFTALEDADTTFSSVESDIAELTCYTGALTEGTALFEESAQAADRGDMELARQKASEAQSALDACNFG